jgi:NAD(P)-dependent dehydrogenase (short-subunit alcohol dehydrogenase family)
MQRLKNKWALVTGASRGIGRQIAKGLAAHGADLILHGRTMDHVKPIADELIAQGATVRVVSGELSDSAALEALVDDALKVSSRIDILYNNAAIMTPGTEPFGATSDDYRKIFEVNTIAPIRICNRIIPGMIERGFGRVINVTSGIKDQPNLMPYAVSKAALDKFVRDLIPAVQGTGVFVNLLDPGWVRTDLGSDRAPDKVESVLPGVLVPALIDTETQGRFFCAQDYKLFEIPK